MKKFGFLAVFIMVLTLGIVVVYATGGSPGSSEDPVVTKSYVDNQITYLKNLQAGNSTYQVVQVPRGKRLIGGAGAEMVLRAGEATIVDKTKVNGVSDLTSGISLMDSNKVITNHQLLIPRADGRGLKAETDLYVMVRGAYEIR